MKAQNLLLTAISAATLMTACNSAAENDVRSQKNIQKIDSLTNATSKDFADLSADILAHPQDANRTFAVSGLKNFQRDHRDVTLTLSNDVNAQGNIDGILVQAVTNMDGEQVVLHSLSYDNRTRAVNKL